MKQNFLQFFLSLSNVKSSPYRPPHFSAFWGSNLFLPFIFSMGFPSSGFSTSEHQLCMASISQADAACLEQLPGNWGLAQSGPVGLLAPGTRDAEPLWGRASLALTAMSDVMGTSERQHPRITEVQWSSSSLQHLQE